MMMSSTPGKAILSLSNLGDDVGINMLTGGPLVAEGPENDLVRKADSYYSALEPKTVIGSSGWSLCYTWARGYFRAW